ncbi:hypothetical protein AB838_21340 [Rhodobacteraceae bacterium (ex Bugula neritina AB1)]|nr:hypothetical protein AB838_21340 [Rhodobacteraceae bacterium (ex Bugula neritina AB1)]
MHAAQSSGAGNHPDIVLGFLEWWDAAVFFDPVRACVIGCKCKLYRPEAIKLSGKVAGCTIQVFVRIEGVFYAQEARSPGHELPQTLRPLWAHCSRVKPAFLIDQCSEQAGELKRAEARFSDACMTCMAQSDLLTQSAIVRFFSVS